MTSGLTESELDALGEIFAEAALDTLWAELQAAEAARDAEAVAAAC